MNLTLVKKYFTLFTLFLSVSFFLIYGCTKIITTDIGGALLPAVDGINTKEMYLDVISKNIKDTATRVGTSDIHSLGYVNDPLFGETTATINLQLKPSFPFYFPVSNDQTKDSLYFDSVVLILSYKGFWGDKSKGLSLKVLEIPSDEPTANLSPDSIYRTDYFVPATSSRELSPSKSLDIGTFNDTNHIRLRLNDSYGREMMYNYDSSNAYKSDSAFSLAFRSKLYQIMPEKTGSGLMKVSLTDTGTKLAIYYHYKDRDTANKIDTAFQYFSCTNTSCGSTNYIKRNRSTGQVAAYLAPNTTENDDLIFIDAAPGIFAKLLVPGLDTVSNKIIHRAEIVMEQVPADFSADDSLTAPNLFLAAYSADTGRRFAIPNDVQFSSASISNQSSLGSFPVSKKDPSTGKTIASYRFDVSRYVQGVVTRDEKTYDFIMFAPFDEFIYGSISTSSQFYTGLYDGSTYKPLNYPAIGRVRLGGGSNEAHKMRLHIVYSDIPK